MEKKLSEIKNSPDFETKFQEHLNEFDDVYRMFYDGLNDTEKAQFEYEENKRPGSRLGSKISKPKASPMTKIAKIEKASQTDPFDFEKEYKKLLNDRFEMTETSFKLDENVRNDFMESDTSLESTSETDVTINSDLMTDDRCESSQGNIHIKFYYKFSILKVKNYNCYEIVI